MNYCDRYFCVIFHLMEPVKLLIGWDLPFCWDQKEVAERRHHLECIDGAQYTLVASQDRMYAVKWGV